MPSSTHIHLIHGFESATGGCEWRTINLYEVLKEHGDVFLWSIHDPNPRLAAQYPITRINAKRLRFPMRGTFVFVGVYYYVGRWIYLTRPSRTILIYNTDDPHFLHEKLQILSVKGMRTVEIVYASETLKRSVNYPGTVEHSLIDTRRFAPAKMPRVSGEFVVGRLSRDVLNKHHEGDPVLYRSLASFGCTVKIMGGTCLADRIGKTPRVILLPSGVEEPDAFLQGLDCFYYRTSSDLFETFGRVVAEAMACGLPVVCHSRGGYAEIIEDGRNGFLFDHEREALRIILDLKKNPSLRHSVGMSARESILSLYSASSISKMLEFYLPETEKPPHLPVVKPAPSIPKKTIPSQA